VTLLIGRTVLDDPDEVKVSGDEITFVADLLCSSPVEMQVKRQQLANLVGNKDEEVIPLVWSDDPTFNGFYRVKSVNLGSHPVMLTTGYVPPATISLQRIGGGYANPTFEVIGTSIVRTNGHGASLGLTPSLFIPDSVTYDLDGFSSVATSDTRPAADGATVQILATGDPNGRSYRFDVSPESYYQASCLVEVEVGGVWFPVVGRQAPRSVRWRISNGVVRITSASSGAGATFEAWTGSAWVSQGISLLETGITPRPIGRWTPGLGAGASRDIPVTVLRNSPETVSLRQSTFSDQVTYSLIRGDRHMTMHWSVSSTATLPTRVGVGMTAGVAGTDPGNRVVANSGPSSVRMMFATAAADTTDTTNTRVRNTTDAYSDTLFAGAVVPPATGLNSDLQVFLQMMCGVTWRQRVVAR
jgi:hypothetical protein